MEEPPAGGRKERRKTDEGRRGWRAQGSCAEPDPLQSPGSPASPNETPSTPKEPSIEDSPELSIPVEPCPKSILSSASSLRLSLSSPPAEKEPPSVGERSVYK